MLKGSLRPSLAGLALKRYRNNDSALLFLEPAVSINATTKGTTKKESRARRRAVQQPDWLLEGVEFEQSGDSSCSFATAIFLRRNPDARQIA